MACACGGGGVTPPAQDRQYLVRLPNGNTVTVTGEHAAQVEITMAGGGTYSVIQ